MVPVWSITNSSVISGFEGSKPISFSATITWAELETGSNSANPCTTARIDDVKQAHVRDASWTMRDGKMSLA